MGLESATFINQLNASWPIGAVDPKAQGDDHLRLIKATLQATFPSITGAVTVTQAQLNAVGGSGITGFAAPTVAVGPSGAAAGAASTALRSDAKLVIDLTASYSWTGTASWAGAAAQAIVFGSSHASGVYCSFARSGTILADIGNAAQVLSGGALDAFSFATRGARNIEIGTNTTLQWRLNTNGQITSPDGTAALPAYSFVSDPDTGVYRFGANTVGIAAGGAAAFAFDTAAAYALDGAPGSPSLSFLSDPDTGFYRSAANQPAIATGGAVRMFWNSTSVVARVAYYAIDGSVSTPGYAFENDPDTGFFRNGSGDIAVTSNNSTIARFVPAANGGAVVADYAGALQVVGYRNIPQNSQSANYTAVLADAGKHLLHPNGGGAGDTFTIPANASVAYDIGTAITFINRDSNALSIAINTDTLILAGTTTTGTRTLGQNGTATAIKVENTVWVISGMGLS